METSEVRIDGSPITMNPLGGGGIPPPIPPIDPLVRPRGIPIVVP